MTIFALSALQGLAFYMLSGYLVTYLIETIGLDSTTALLSNMVALGFLTVAIPLGGILGDRIGREPMMFAGCAVIALLSLPAFLLAESGTLAAAVAGQVMLALEIPFFATGFTPAQAEILPTRVRHSGNAITWPTRPSVARLPSCPPFWCRAPGAQRGACLLPRRGRGDRGLLRLSYARDLPGPAAPRRRKAPGWVRTRGDGGAPIVAARGLHP